MFSAYFLPNIDMFSHRCIRHHGFRRCGMQQHCPRFHPVALSPDHGRCQLCRLYHCRIRPELDDCPAHQLRTDVCHFVYCQQIAAEKGVILNADSYLQKVVKSLNDRLQKIKK